MVQLRVFALALIMAACGEKNAPKELVIIENVQDTDNLAYAGIGKLKLSEYGFFKEPLANLTPANRVFPYEMNTPLFTDYALKKRFIYIPENTSANYHDSEVLEFPVGSVLIKNFYYDGGQLQNEPGRIIETRLLIREESGWKALPYIWNKEQTDAFLEITGGGQVVTLKSAGAFSYAVPTMAQCKSCHEKNGIIAPIGPTARQLNRIENGKNQLTSLVDAGMLQGLPDLSEVRKLASWADDESGSIDDRARAYLEINCGHCHRPVGPGKNSGLNLTIFSPTEQSLGVLKAPVAAGAGSGNLQYDIVPGEPENSILVYRMESTSPGVMMPELGRKLVHLEGIDLIKSWIKSMKK